MEKPANSSTSETISGRSRSQEEVASAAWRRAFLFIVLRSFVTTEAHGDETAMNFRAIPSLIHPTT
jgi:hypothetical protein